MGLPIRLPLMADSLQAPSADALNEICRLFPTLHTWGGYVCGDGLASDELWRAEDVEVIFGKGLSFLPIAAPDWAVDQDAEVLAYELFAFMEELGVSDGAGALDTEYQERGNPRITATVNGFENHLRQVAFKPVIYGGAGYYGNAHQWLPAWTAPAGTLGPAPANPLPGNARQFAGDINFVGLEVDLSLVGSAFPVCSR